MKKLISGGISNLEVHFSSFKSNPVLLATSIFSLFIWPSDHSALAKFGYDEVRLLSTHFSHLLQQRGYVPESCLGEWPELKSARNIADVGILTNVAENLQQRQDANSYCEHPCTGKDYLRTGLFTYKTSHVRLIGINDYSHTQFPVVESWSKVPLAF